MRISVDHHAPPTANSSEEAAIHALHQQLVESWHRGDGVGYAAAFTEDADYVAFNGVHLKGVWVELRRQWEYSHAFSAVLNVVALIVVIQSVLSGKDYCGDALVGSRQEEVYHGCQTDYRRLNDG